MTTAKWAAEKDLGDGVWFFAPPAGLARTDRIRFVAVIAAFFGWEQRGDLLLGGAYG